jgi:hypothetical protein
MDFIIHRAGKNTIAELKSDKQLINNVSDAVDLLGNASYNDAAIVALKKENLHPGFFELRTGLAGEILQKFSNYRMQLAILGDFSMYKSKALRDFIYESNKAGRILFLSSMEDALQNFSA